MTTPKPNASPPINRGEPLARLRGQLYEARLAKVAAAAENKRLRAIVAQMKGDATAARIAADETNNMLRIVKGVAKRLRYERDELREELRLATLDEEPTVTRDQARPIDLSALSGSDLYVLATLINGPQIARDAYGCRDGRTARPHLERLNELGLIERARDGVRWEITEAGRAALDLVRADSLG